MRVHTLVSVTRGLLIGLDVLTAGLIVIAMLQADPSVPRWVPVVVALTFGALYGWGRATIRVHEAPISSPRGAWWPTGAWATSLVLLWVGLLLTSEAALWIAFPLVLLQMHVLGPRRGALAAAVTTAVAASYGLSERGAGDGSIGFVLGPVLGGAIAVAITLGFEALVRESQERRTTMEELAVVREHLAATEQDAAVAGERERLARDIHDTLAQGFSAIELLLRAADQSIGQDDARARGYVSQARETAQDNLGEARRFVRELAPPDLDDVPLAAALRRVARRTQQTAAGGGPSTSLQVQVETSGVPRALPITLETALIRIAQSTLANVVQHSGARNAHLTFTYLQDEVILDIVDDGRGFNPALPPDDARPGGFGLVALRSRVRELGGTVAVETSPGDGTAVAVRLPAAEHSSPTGKHQPGDASVRGRG